MINNKQTPVEFFNDKIEDLLLKNDYNEISDEEFLEEKYNILIISKQKEKENMINFLKSVFQLEGFDYEQAYNNFISKNSL